MAILIGEKIGYKFSFLPIEQKPIEQKTIISVFYTLIKKGEN
jgi:hypothetical protein